MLIVLTELFERKFKEEIVEIQIALEADKIIAVGPDFPTKEETFSSTSVIVSMETGNFCIKGTFYDVLKQINEAKTK